MGNGVVGEAGGSAKGGTHHVMNVRNSLHIFVATPDNGSFFKNSQHRVTPRFFSLRVNDMVTRRIVMGVPSTGNMNKKDCHCHMLLTRMYRYQNNFF